MANRNTIEIGNLCVMVDRHLDGCTLTLHDSTTNQRFGPVPLLVMEVYDRMLLRVDRVTSFTVEDVRRVDDAIHVTLQERRRGLRVGLWIRITEAQELSVWLSPAEVYESRANLYRLFAIDLLPGFITSEAPAQLLLPLNTGMVCKTAEKPACEDRFLIYGQQACWEILPTMPICALQAPAGGMVALAAEGAAETECRVRTDGVGGSVGLSFFFRGDDIDPIENSPREIRYTPVPAAADLAVFTADVLRTHIMRDLGKTTLEQRAAESPEVKYLLQAYIMKLFYGVQAQGCMLNEDGSGDGGRFILTMTFDEAANGLKRFHDAGVDKIYTQNVGWNYRGHDGAYPTRFPVEQRSGGEAAFRNLIAYGHELGYQMTVHDNYLDAYEVSPDLDPETVMVDRYGQMQVRGFWGGGTSYLLWPLAFQHKHLEDQMLRIKEMGIRGPFYLDGMGSPLYINYHPRHRGSRTQMVRGTERLLRTAREIYGSSATETGYLYCSIIPDLVANPGNDHLLSMARPEWKITALLDRCIPLWQMAMSGLVITENQGLSWKDTMCALLYNQQPRYEWSTRPGVQPVLDDAMIARIKFRYDLLIKKYGHLRLQRMVDFKRDGSVESTTYEDGTCVTGDFATGSLTVDDQRIVEPNDGQFDGKLRDADQFAVA
jgi:hypothetical protein